MMIVTLRILVYFDACTIVHFVYIYIINNDSI